MSKSDNIQTLNMGIVGHIDHGKTTLLHKLSGKWTDTHSEELKRGITIKLGYADIVIHDDNGEYNREKGKALRHISFVDAPGHEMLMATMLSGAAIIDAAILVVAANEGIKPQTREHLMALQAKGIKNLIVVQNKIDLVDIEKAKSNHKAIMDMLKGKFEKAVVIPVSAQQDINLDKIYKAIMEIEIPKRDEEGNPIFVVARSFDINKPGTKPSDLHGTVLGGTLKKGTLKVGDKIEIKPGKVIQEANQIHYKTLNTTILKLFQGSKQVNELTPGGSMSIETELDMALGKSDALSGCVVSKAGTLPDLSTSITISHKLFPEFFMGSVAQKTEAIKPSEMVLLSINTSMSIGVVKRIQGDKLEINLKIPMIPFKGDSVGIARNINNHWRLIGQGTVL